MKITKPENYSDEGSESASNKIQFKAKNQLNERPRQRKKVSDKMIKAIAKKESFLSNKSLTGAIKILISFFTMTETINFQNLSKGVVQKNFMKQILKH